MTTLEGTLLSSQETERGCSGRRPEGRPALFAALLGFAGLILLVVLVGGPMLPPAISVPCALGAIILVLSGWVLAGPRL